MNGIIHRSQIKRKNDGNDETRVEFWKKIYRRYLNLNGAVGRYSERGRVV